MIPPLLLALPIVDSFGSCSQELVPRSYVFTLAIIILPYNFGFRDLVHFLWIEERALASFLLPLFATKPAHCHKDFWSGPQTQGLDTAFSKHSAGQWPHIDRAQSFYTPRMMKIFRSTFCKSQFLVFCTLEPTLPTQHFAYIFDFLRVQHGKAF